MSEADKSTVFFSDLRATSKRNLFDKIDELLLRVNIGEKFSKSSLVAVKLHFGERGGSAFLKPVFVRRVVERIKDTGALPFLTDTNTLYVGSRTNSAAHLKCAIENGFDYSVVGAPIIIADGLRGENKVDVEVEGRHLKKVSLAGDIVEAKGMVVLTHFKCHEMAGFGGALKNLGMGCASKAGKLIQHSNCAPVVKEEGCTACGDCVLVCPSDAIDIGHTAVINEAACIGCGHCIAACPEGTIDVQWNETAVALQEKMIEHAAGALKGKEGKTVFVNFINAVSPFCDCYGHTDAPIVPDVGIVASTDPVAIDQASVDLVNSKEGFKDTALASGHRAGGDKFRGVHPSVDWSVQLKRAEEMGLGKRAYTIVEI